MIPTGSDPQEILDHDYHNCSCHDAKLLKKFRGTIDDELHRLNDTLIVDHDAKDGDGVSLTDKITIIEQMKRTLNRLKVD